MSILVLVLLFLIAGGTSAAYLLLQQQSDPALEEGLVVSGFPVADMEGETELKAKLWRLPKASSEKLKGVILMSHGFSANSDSLRLYATQLARAGYIVAAVSHADLKGLRSGLIANDPMVARQRHLKLLLNRLYEENIELQSLPLGILGYSLGGYAALTSTQFPALLDKQAAYCETLSPAENVLVCNPRFSQRISAITSQRSLIAAPEIPATAIALFAPAYMQLIDLNKHTDSLAVFLANGKLDEFVNSSEMDVFAQRHSYVKDHQTIEKAGHYVFLPRCSWPLNYFIESCRDPIPINRIDYQNNLAKDVVSFFDKNLITTKR